MRSLTRSVLLMLGLVFTTSAGGQTLEQSRAAYALQDYQTALTGFKKLADQGNASAQYALGVGYADGQGMPKDQQQAVAWYRKAAEQGDAEAQNNLGAMYALGQGVPKDDQQAYFWWLLASAQGHQNATKGRDQIEPRLMPQQRADAQAAARIWQPK